MLALEYNVRCFAPPLPNHKSTIPRIRTARARGQGQGQGQPSFSSCGFGLGLVWVCLICWMDWTVGWGVGRGTALLYYPCATFSPLFAALHPQDGISSGIRLYSRVSTPGPQILYNTVFSWLPLCIPHVGSPYLPSLPTAVLPSPR